MLKNKRTSRTKWLDIFKFLINQISNLFCSQCYIFHINWLVLAIKQSLQGSCCTKLIFNYFLVSWGGGQRRDQSRSSSSRRLIWGAGSWTWQSRRSGRSAPGRGERSPPAPGRRGGRWRRWLCGPRPHSPSSVLQSTHRGLTLIEGKRGRKNWQILSTEWPFQS